MPRCSRVDINDAALRHDPGERGFGRRARDGACRATCCATFPAQFDLIVANPPYLIDPGASGPIATAAARSAPGLSLKILDAAIERLAPGGTLLLYTGAAIVDGARSVPRGRGRGLAAPALPGHTTRSIQMSSARSSTRAPTRTPTGSPRCLLTAKIKTWMSRHA